MTGFLTSLTVDELYFIINLPICFLKSAVCSVMLYY